HDDHAIRHGHAQRPRPLSPRDRRDRPRAIARLEGVPHPPGNGRPTAAQPAVHARPRPGSPRDHQLGLAQVSQLLVLVLNAGSSSLKVSLVDEEDNVLADSEFQLTDGRIDQSQLATAVHGMEGVEAIGHRVVHGGPRYRRSVRIDADVIRYLVTITDLAPLHLPAALAGIAAARELLPHAPAVACLDTAFHPRMPEAASTDAVPEEWRVRYGVHRS